MSANQLLLDIQGFISASVRDDLTETDKRSLRFSNGMDIVEAIDAYFDQSNIEIIEEYDPFRDPDARALLGLAGINVHGRR
jgi:hypothetical protein